MTPYCTKRYTRESNHHLEKLESVVLPKRGLTIAEVLVAIALLGTIVVSTALVFTSLLSSSTKSTDSSAALYYAQTQLDEAAKAGPPDWGGLTGSQEIYTHDPVAPTTFSHQLTATLIYSPPATRISMGDLYQLDLVVYWWSSSPGATRRGMGQLSTRLGLREDMNRGRRASSLLELLVAMGILLLISGVAFLLFGMGTRGFRVLVAQQGLESQLRRFTAVVRRELLVTHYGGVCVHTTPTAIEEGTTFDRHAVCFPGLSDWYASGAYEPTTGLPNWNRYILYYATTESPGRLFRCLIDPGAVFAAGPLTAFSNNPQLYVPLDPKTVPGQVSITTLATDLLEFRVGLNLQETAIQLNLKLLDNRSNKLSGGRNQEIQEVNLRVTPLNTVPKL